MTETTIQELINLDGFIKKAKKIPIAPGKTISYTPETDKSVVFISLMGKGFIKTEERSIAKEIESGAPVQIHCENLSAFIISVNKNASSPLVLLSLEF